MKVETWNDLVKWIGRYSLIEIYVDIYFATK